MAKMFKLDDNLLQEIGLGALPPAEKNQMLSHIYMTLETRVGVKLAEQMSPEQLDEFERFIDTGANGSDISYSTNFLNETKPEWKTSEEYQTQLKSAQDAAARTGRPFNENAVISEFAALTWLETNFPSYKDVVAAELEKLKGEVKTVAPQILQASAAQAQAMQQQMAMQQRMAAQGQPMYAPQGYPAGYPAQPMAAPQGYYQQPMPQYAQPAPQGYYYQQAPVQPGYGQPMPQQAYRPVQQPMPQQQYPQAPAAPAQPQAPAPQPPQQPPAPASPAPAATPPADNAPAA